MNTHVMDKPIEYAFTLALALSAPLLQAVIQFEPTTLFTSLAVLSGAMTYFTRAVVLEKMSTKVAVFSALTALPFGYFLAPALAAYYNIKQWEYIMGFHYVFGLVGVLAMNTIWSIMAGIHRDAYPAFKSWLKSWIVKKPTS